MWQITTAKELKACEHCDHPVLKGQGCLTGVPELISENSPPKEYRHFHIECEECQVDRSCYEMLAARNTPVRSKDDIECTYCEHFIAAGQDLLWDYYFASDLEAEEVGSDWVGFVGFLRRVKKPSFNNLSANIKDKFVNAGLGGGRGVRTTAEAAEFYRSSIPSFVRNLGENAVKEFTKGKHASHIESVANAPSKMKSIGNLVWESAKRNRNRGSFNMTRADQLGAHAKNGAHAAKIGATTAAAKAGLGAGLAALFEAPVSITENVIYVIKGKKSREQAAIDTAKNVGKAGIVGGTVVAGITVATSLGAAPILAAAAPVLGAVGAGLFGISAFRSIRHAMQETENSKSSRPLPSDTLPLFFHAACQECVNDCSCFELFAAEVSAYSEKSDFVSQEVLTDSP
ncbi:MAG: hypothetical protein IIC83_06060 [Chloroflexi bacterium]|nr:hypothetical protein [Chloroflexota bacterium]